MLFIHFVLVSLKCPTVIDSVYNDIVRRLMQMLCLIGEAFDDETDEICGAVINIRMKGDKIALWTRDAENMDSNMKIG